MFGMVCAWPPPTASAEATFPRYRTDCSYLDKVRETPHPHRAGDTIAELDRKYPIIQNAVLGI